MIYTTLFRKTGLALFAVLLLRLTAQGQDFAKFFVFGPANPFANTTFISSHELSDSSGFLILGDRYNVNNRNGFVIKTDSALNEVWTTALGFQGAQPPYDQINFYDIGELMNGNIYVYGVAGPGGTSPHYVLFVLSPTGQLLNHVALYDSLNNTNGANLTSIELAHDSSIIIPLSEYERYGFYRLDQNLNLLSYAFFRDTTTTYSTGRDCILLSDSTMLMNTEYGLTKTDINGNLLWARKYPNLIRTYSVMQSSTGSVYVSTYTSMMPVNAALAKFDANGNPVFVKTYSMSPGTTTSPGWKVYPVGNDLMIYSDSVMFRTDTNGNVIGMGKTVDAYNNKIMRPALNDKFTVTGQIMQDSVGSYQYTLMRFDDSTQMGCLHPRSIVMSTMALPQFAAVAIPQTVMIVRDTIAFTVTGVNLDFDAVDGCPANPLSVDEPEHGGGLQCFPNPASENIQLQFGNTKWNYTVYDGIGRIVENGTSDSDGRTTLDVSAWANGVYSVVVMDDAVRVAKTFVVNH